MGQVRGRADDPLLQRLAGMDARNWSRSRHTIRSRMTATRNVYVSRPLVMDEKQKQLKRSDLASNAGQASATQRQRTLNGRSTDVQRRGNGRATRKWPQVAEVEIALIDFRTAYPKPEGATLTRSKRSSYQLSTEVTRLTRSWPALTG